jgi:hypothetical protein
MPIDLRYVLTCAALAAATLWLAVLALLSGTRDARSRRERLLLAALLLALLAAIASLLYA